MPAAPVIRLAHLGKHYETRAGPVPVLKDVNLDIGPAEFVAIMGPSGSGKSTLMSILGCLDAPSDGTYVFEGRDVGALSRDQLADLRNRVIGFVFQGFNLLPRATLLDNVALPLVYAGVGKSERPLRARYMLANKGASCEVRRRAAPADSGPGRAPHLGFSPPAGSGIHPISAPGIPGIASHHAANEAFAAGVRTGQPSRRGPRSPCHIAIVRRLA